MNSELDLIQRCRQADRQAQRMLYEQTSPRIYRLLLKLTGNEADAADLAQDTYLRAFTNIKKFKGQSSIATWLYRIAVNEALQLLRRQKRRRPSETRDDAREPLDPSRPDSSTRLDISQALQSLDPSDRTVLLLRYHEAMDYRTIAEAMDCAEGTVASRLNRARRRLKERLGDAYLMREEVDTAVHPNDGTDVEMPTRTLR